MQINVAHIREQSVSGGPVDYAVFDARSVSGSDHDNAELLARLTIKARAANLNVDQSALAFVANGQIRFYGTPTLVTHLSSHGVPIWTHTIND